LYFASLSKNKAIIFPERSPQSQNNYSGIKNIVVNKHSLMKKCVHIRVYGQVQHKGFRFTAMQVAYQRGIRGFIQNMKGGYLYIVAEGEEEQLYRIRRNGAKRTNMGKSRRCNR